MSGVRGVPPGRAGRTWLSRRVRTAQHGASLLDRKLRILRREQHRFRDRADTAGARWARVLEGAEQWALRSVLLGGSAALRPPYDDPPAGVRVDWSAVMGARFPAAARLELPGHRRDGPLPASSAVVCATAAYREALVAAVDAAVALAAARVLDDEVAATRFRLRAVQDRWVPRLERAATTLDLALAEAEGAEAVRLRLAVSRREGGPDDGATGPQRPAHRDGWPR